MRRIDFILALALLFPAPAAFGQVRNFPEIKDSSFRVPALAFRTNLLAPLTNVGIEVPVSDRISLEADFYSPWVPREWFDRNFPAHSRCFQFVGGTLGCRFWPGALNGALPGSRAGGPRCRLLGHSVGVIVSGGVYDVERGGAGRQGEFASLGIDYLYALPLGGGGVRMEFNVGVGCAVGGYQDYYALPDGGELIKDGGRRTVCRPVPVRVGVSVVFPVFIRGSRVSEGREGLAE